MKMTTNSYSMDKKIQLSVVMFDAAYPPPVLGGKEKQAHLLAKTLLSRGVNVKALSYEHNGNTSEVYEGVFVKRVKKGFLAPVMLGIALVECRKFFSVLHIHTPSRIGKIVALIGFFLRYKIVFKFPNEHLLDSTNWLDRAVWCGLFKVADLLVVLEEDTKNKLKARGPLEEKLFFVENGVEMIAPIKMDTSNPVRLIFVGRLVPQKACDQLIHACDLLRDWGVDFSLIIFGDGPLKDELSCLVDKLNLEGNISFEGYCSAPIDRMKESHILVLPSLYEGMSNVLLEAISIGLPIIATDVGAAKKQVGSCGEQFLCEPLDQGCLAEIIKTLFNNPQIRKEYGDYLYNRGCQIFAIEIVAEKYIKEYKRISAS